MLMLGIQLAYIGSTGIIKTFVKLALEFRGGLIEYQKRNEVKYMI